MPCHDVSCGRAVKRAGVLDAQRAAQCVFGTRFPVSMFLPKLHGFPLWPPFCWQIPHSLRSRSQRLIQRYSLAPASVDKPPATAWHPLEVDQSSCSVTLFPLNGRPHHSRLPHKSEFRRRPEARRSCWFSFWRVSVKFWPSTVGFKKIPKLELLSTPPKITTQTCDLLHRIQSTHKWHK